MFVLFCSCPGCPFSQRDSGLPDGTGQPAGVDGESATGGLEESESSFSKSETHRPGLTRCDVSD